MKMPSKKMRAGGILLVVALAVSCVAGGTLAKYVSKGEGGDTARVAKWGVTVKAGEGTTFASSYKKNSANHGEDEVGNGGFTVVSEDGSVVAPGTGGTFNGIEIEGTPEVAVEIVTSAAVDLGEDGDWEVDNEFYCPLVFKIGDEVICGLHYDNIGSFESAIEKAIADTTDNPLNVGSDRPGTYPAKQSLDDVAVNFSWEWPFENSYHDDCEKTDTSNSSYHEKDQTDTNDTALGNMEPAPRVSIVVTTTVTQVD